MIKIEKGQRIENIYKKNFSNFNNLEILTIKIYHFYNKIFLKKFIHYGEFFIEDNTNSLQILNTISKPSNVVNKIIIVEGWSQDDLNNELSKFFTDYYQIPYEDIIADTYFFDKNSTFKLFVKKLINNKNQYFERFKKNKVYKNFSNNEIMTIGSLIEKEGLDANDKRKISTVIFNRLNINMKLQIDATVLFAITNGRFDLGRKLSLNDLKIDNPYNTYKFKGLPPKPISYVGKKTLDIMFEDNTSDFLFYFFNNSLKSHIFSKNYEEHKKKLYEYRNR